MRSSALPPAALQIIRAEHNALAAMLRSLAMMVERGPEAEPARYFEVLRSMLFYVDEFPERRHHPKESNHLFPRVAQAAPELAAVIAQLEADHQSGEQRVRELQHLLTAWELLGESRREAFAAAARDYVRFHLEHIRTEETALLPLAVERLSTQDWQQLEAVFEDEPDPLTAGRAPHPSYERLFSHIVATAPAPIGVGAA